MKLKLNISPCPNDIFMFDAIVNGRIDTHGLEFEMHTYDIEQLNDRIINGDDPVDISKISYAVLPLVRDRYKLLDSGSALGYNTGPVFVAKQPLGEEGLKHAKVALPGKHTTASLLLSKFFPNITDRKFMLFSDIAEAILEGKADAGVLIHEGRFTFRERGLHLIADLGRLWEESVAMPLPLGAVVVSRQLPAEIQHTVEKTLKESILYAMRNPDASREFVKHYAQEMDDTVITSHIETFVTGYSLGLDGKAREGICSLLDMDYQEVFL